MISFHFVWFDFKNHVIRQPWTIPSCENSYSPCGSYGAPDPGDLRLYMRILLVVLEHYNTLESIFLNAESQLLLVHNQSLPGILHRAPQLLEWHSVEPYLLDIAQIKLYFLVFNSLRETRKNSGYGY